jgi:hypothetical protein
MSLRHLFAEMAIRVHATVDPRSFVGYFPAIFRQKN